MLLPGWPVSVCKTTASDRSRLALDDRDEIDHTGILPETNEVISLSGGTGSTSGYANNDLIAIVLITHNRVHILRECVENVLSKTSTSTEQIVVWDNASTDGTTEYLDSLSDPRLTVVHHSKNIGSNGYAEAFELTTAPYLIELDDDVTEAPLDWDRTLLDAWKRIPDIGFLAADLEEDDRDDASRIRHRDQAHLYCKEIVNGIPIIDGPTGGACAMTSREVYERAGGFPRYKDKSFFLEDAAYIGRIERLGYRKAILADLRVHHAGGSYNGGASAKEAYWHAYWKAAKRRNSAKRILLRIPFVPALNERYRWFDPLEWEEGRPTPRPAER